MCCKFKENTRPQGRQRCTAGRTKNEGSETRTHAKKMKETAERKDGERKREVKEKVKEEKEDKER